MTLPRRRTATPPGVSIQRPLIIEPESGLQVEYPDPTTAIVSLEHVDSQGVTAYRVSLDYDRGNRVWNAFNIDPHPPTNALANLLATEAVEMLTEKEERDYREAAADVEVLR